MKKTKTPIELYKFKGICDFNFEEPPVAEFIDADGYGTSMDMEQLDKIIQHCLRYGFDREVFVEAMNQLQKIQKIFDNMKEPDNIPIQR